jgi:Leucine-rich repeat (LRR) protein
MIVFMVVMFSSSLVQDNFGNLLVRLTKLDLSKNRLTRLPGNIGRLQNLEHLDLFQNQVGPS